MERGLQPVHQPTLKIPRPKTGSMHEHSDYLLDVNRAESHEDEGAPR